SPSRRRRRSRPSTRSRTDRTTRARCSSATAGSATASRRPRPGRTRRRRARYNGTVPPDMSVLAKARTYERGFPLFLVDALPFFAYQEHGVDYVVALL